MVHISTPNGVCGAYRARTECVPRQAGEKCGQIFPQNLKSNEINHLSMRPRADARGRPHRSGIQPVCRLGSNPILALP